MKLKYKLVYIPAAMAFLFFAIVVSVSFYQFRTTINESVLNNQRLLVGNISQTVDEYLSQYAGLVTYIQTIDALKDISEQKDIDVAYRGLSDRQSVEIRQLFKNAMATHEQFAYIATYTKDQAINVLLEPYDIQLEIPIEDYYRGFSYRDWYEGAMSSRGTYISEAYISAAIFEPVVAISTPIFEEDEIIAIMIGAVRLSELNSRIAELSFGQTGQSYIVDKNGHIVAHPDESFFNDEELYSIQGSDILADMASGGQGGRDAGLKKAKDPITGQEVYFSYNQVERTGWYIITQVAVSEIEGPVTRFFNLIVILSALVFSLFVLLLYLNVIRVVKRMEFLSFVSAKVLDGALDTIEIDDSYMKDNPLTDDESSQLLHSFSAMIERLKESFHQIDFLANHDPLTSLPNRRLFRRQMTTILKEGMQGAVIMLDLDNFKLINDTQGHLFGDEVLVKVAETLQQINYSDYFVSRFGGDEFLICVMGMEGDVAISDFADRIKNKLRSVKKIGDVAVDLHGSMGVAKFPEDGMEINQLVKYADLALYQAKERGKNQFILFNQIFQEQIVNKVDIERAIQRALVEDGFELLYQPQVDLLTGEILAFEALIRFKDRSYNPGQFIPVAEETGQIIEIGRWVTDQALRQLSIWRREGYPIKPVSVNYSAAQRNDVTYIDFVRRTLDKYHISPDYLELEITEYLFIREWDDTVGMLASLNEIGINISIDDFGTGYSSIGYLMTLPVQKVKLDRSLSMKFLNQDGHDTIDAIVSLVESFGMAVIAEGIEEREDIDKLIESGCKAVQGYYFDRPLEADAAAQRLIRNYELVY